jgi:hypothetical protein
MGLHAAIILVEGLLEQDDRRHAAGDVHHFAGLFAPKGAPEKFLLALGRKAPRLGGMADGLKSLCE